jgi:hypothetical protein
MAIDLEKLLQSGGGGSYLTGDEKNALYESRVPFVVVDAQPRVESAYGEQTVFTIKIKGEEEQRRLAFTHNDGRERIATAMRTLLDQGEQYVGPIYLGKWTNGGRSGWELVSTPPSDDDAPIDLPKASDTKSAEGKARTPAGRVDPDDGSIPW